MSKVQWVPGMNPRLHPLWREQVALETDMVQRGADHYREMVAKARNPGAAKGKDGKYPPEMTRILVYRKAMLGIVQGMGEGLKAWFANFARSRLGPSRTPYAYKRMLGLDPYVIAFITVRTIMDAASVQKLTLTSTARQIGLAVEQEHRMNAWIAEEPALWAEVQRGLTDQKATDDHRHKVNVNRFNALVRDRIAWQDWSAEERLHVGLNAIDVLCRTTTDILVEEEDITDNPTGHGNGRMVIRLSEGLTSHIAKGLARDETKMPYYMPTLMPPKRWNGIRSGGYYTKFVRVPWLIRFHADNSEVRGIAADEYDTLDMPRVFEAVRLVQETPWRINKRVYAVALEVWDRDLGIAGITRRDKSPLPLKSAAVEKALKMVKDWERKNLRGMTPSERKEFKAPPRIVKAREVSREWKVAAAAVYGENARRIGHTTSARHTITIAAKFLNREFYFPHMLDFRGRMYPIPLYLQPQGHDLARGLLTFANGKPIGPEDSGWLAIHLANCWGNDKVAFDDRIAWVEANEAMWRRISAAPLASLEWTQSDDPWQTLAAIFEWVRFLEEGIGMVSSLPIRVDGTCNGIQHLSAMMRDEVGGASVNLVPSSSPRDIYKEVADILLERLSGIRDAMGLPGQQADWWLQRFPVTGGGIPRSFTKNPVMVLPYGGTKDSYFGSIHKWINKHDSGGKTFPQKEKKVMVPFMKDHMWDAVGEKVVKGKECMEWLKEVAAVVAETGQPIFWTTPTGFHVRHFYGKETSTQITTKINGKVLRLRLNKRTKVLAKREQLQGISPNFVHSMDASANMETILLFHEQNEDDPPAYTSIHDAYGTTAGQMWSLYHCLREAFIRVHSHDVLADFRDRCVLLYRDHLYAKDLGKSLELCWEIAEDTIKPVPEKGSLDIENVRNSDYFFA